MLMWTNRIEQVIWRRVIVKNHLLDVNQRDVVLLDFSAKHRLTPKKKAGPFQAVLIFDGEMLTRRIVRRWKEYSEDLPNLVVMSVFDETEFKDSEKDKFITLAEVSETLYKLFGSRKWIRFTSWNRAPDLHLCRVANGVMGVWLFGLAYMCFLIWRTIMTVFPKAFSVVCHGRIQGLRYLVLIQQSQACSWRKFGSAKLFLVSSTGYVVLRQSLTV